MQLAGILTAFLAATPTHPSAAAEPSCRQELPAAEDTKSAERPPAVDATHATHQVDLEQRHPLVGLEEEGLAA